VCHRGAHHGHGARRTRNAARLNPNPNPNPMKSIVVRVGFIKESTWGGWWWTATPCIRASVAVRKRLKRTSRGLHQPLPHGVAVVDRAPYSPIRPGATRRVLPSERVKPFARRAVWFGLKSARPSLCHTVGQGQQGAIVPKDDMGSLPPREDLGRASIRGLDLVLIDFSPRSMPGRELDSEN